MFVARGIMIQGGSPQGLRFVGKYIPRVTTTMALVDITGLLSGEFSTMKVNSGVPLVPYLRQQLKFLTGRDLLATISSKRQGDLLFHKMPQWGMFRAASN